MLKKQTISWSTMPFRRSRRCQESINLVSKLRITCIRTNSLALSKFKYISIILAFVLTWPLDYHYNGIACLGFGLYGIGLIGVNSLNGSNDFKDLNHSWC